MLPALRPRSSPQREAKPRAWGCLPTALGPAPRPHTEEEEEEANGRGKGGGGGRARLCGAALPPSPSSHTTSLREAPRAPGAPLRPQPPRGGRRGAPGASPFPGLRPRLTLPGAPRLRGARGRERSASPECPTPPSGTRQPWCGWGRGPRLPLQAGSSYCASALPLPPRAAPQRLCACVVQPPPPPGGRGGVQVLMVRGFESLLVPEPPGIPERPVTVGRRVFVCF